MAEWQPFFISNTILYITYFYQHSPLAPTSHMHHMQLVGATWRMFVKISTKLGLAEARRYAIRIINIVEKQRHLASLSRSYAAKLTVLVFGHAI